MTFTIPVPEPIMSPRINRNWYWSLFPLTDSEIQKGLATAKLTKNRTEWLKAANGAEILSDVYNAN